MSGTTTPIALPTRAFTRIEELTTHRRYTFRRSQRLKEQLVFLRATRKGDRESRGPLVFHAVRGSQPLGRIGIRISRRCGTAPRRNQIKRLLRESYRLMQHDWPIAIDLVITVKPHEPLSLADYQRLLSGAMVKLCGRISAQKSQ